MHPGSVTSEIDGSTLLRRVLIVNDDQDAGDTFADLAEWWGHAVQVARDGPSAVRVVREYRPDVVLLDLDRTDVDRGEVARSLRQSPGEKAMVLVAFTSYEADTSEGKREAGINHCLLKPVDPEALRRLLAAVEPAA